MADPSARAALGGTAAGQDFIGLVDSRLSHEPKLQGELISAAARLLKEATGGSGARGACMPVRSPRPLGGRCWGGAWRIVAIHNIGHLRNPCTASGTRTPYCLGPPPPTLPCCSRRQRECPRSCGPSGSAGAFR